MAAQALDRQMGLAGVGRPEDRADPAVGIVSAHYPANVAAVPPARKPS
jgi:hypothetical protein